MRTVKVMYQGNVIEGEIIRTKISSTIETDDNPDSIKVMLHRLKVVKPIKVLWDDVEKVVSELWIDNNAIITE
jgi:hypothetical protein